ncbi:MAG: MG2 domain-containing protein [Bacteroidaceae bacterium]|nr:MG2 domain-containing protein [Bacteroidaceae bacterium]
MRSKLLFGMVLALAFAPCGAQRKYDSMWKDIEKCVNEDLPRQVIDKSREIMVKAQKEGNFPQEMKAWVTMVDALRELSPDSMKVVTAPDYKHSAANDAMANALLASSITHKDDSLRKTYLSRVLENKEVLLRTNTDGFLPLITKGEDSRLYGHDLLSLLTRFVLNIGRLSTEEKDSLVSDVALFYKEKGNKEAYTLMTLTRYGLIRKHDQRMDSLKVLLQEAKGLEAEYDVARKVYSEFRTDDTDEKIEFVRWGINEFPDKKDYFIEMEKELLRPSCTLSSTQDAHYGGVKFPIALQYKNIDVTTLEIRLYNGEDSNDRLRTDGKLVESRQYEFGKDSASMARRAKRLPFSGEVRDSLLLPAEKYVFVLKGAGDEYVIQKDLTDLAPFIAEIPGRGWVAYVLNAITGLPVSGATVTAEFNSEKLKRTFTTGDDGTAVLDLSHDKARMWHVTAQTSNRNITSTKTIYTEEYDYSPRSDELHAFIYPDRNIYRPNQNVNVAVVAYSQDGDDCRVYSKDSIEVTLTNYNGFDASRKVMPNAMGTASCTFELPKDVKPGMFNCSVFGTSVNFQVEEYKRPSYYLVEQEELIKSGLAADNKDISFGDTAKVRLRVLSYSGVPVQSAKVAFTTTVNTGENYFRAYHTEETLLDTAFTDAQGFAELTIFIDPKHDDNDQRQRTVRYRTTYSVTDQSGETHDGSYGFTVSRQGFGLRLVSKTDCIDLAEQDKEGMEIHVTNIDGVDVDAVLVMNPRYSLTDPDSAVVAEGGFEPNKSLIIPQVPSGTYTLRVSANDRNGNLIQEKMDVSIYSHDVNVVNKGERTRFARSFCHVRDNDCSETEPGIIYFSPQYDGLQVHCLVMAEDKLIKEEVFAADQRLYRLEFPYKKEYGAGFIVRLFFVKNGTVDIRGGEFNYRLPDKRLDLSWKTFRDRLTPGQKETWTLTVRTPDGKPVGSAGLVATMYDASLESIFKPWFYNEVTPHFGRDIRHHSLSSLSSWSRLYMHVAKDLKSYSTDFQRKFSMLTHYFGRGLRFRSDEIFHTYSHAVLREVNVRAKGAVPTSGLAVEEFEGLGMVADDNALQGRIAGLNIVEKPEAEEDWARLSGYGLPLPQPSSVQAVSIRKDFSEQGFFFPDLVTDKNGDVDISFTLPESLTEWRFYGMVHDKEMNGGRIDAKAVARQEFMIRPNMPRFIREGDKATIAATIFNQTDRQLSGTAMLRLVNPDDDSTITVTEVPFTAGADSSTAVTFRLPAGIKQHAGLVCEVTAASATFADGERHTLVVLPTDETGTKPFTPKTTNLYDMVFSALEMMRVSEEDNTVSHAASLYANTKLKELRRTNDSISTDSLDFHIAQALRRLSELQYADGSWSWFAGMEGNYHITLLTCENLARTDSVGKDLLAKGVDYLDQYELRRYNELRRQKKPSFTPSETTLHYLHILSMMPERTLSKDVREMCDTYLKELEKLSAGLTIMGKADASVILRRDGKRKPADKLVRSVMEYSVFREGMGRYFDTRKALYSWRDYRIPTQLAAIRALRATPDTRFLTPDYAHSEEDMLLWLLRQKQVQKWDNPSNTVDVADLLLSVSPDKGATPPDWAIATDDSAFFADGLKVETVFEGKMDVGETVEMVITVTADRDMDFVKVTARQPACLEPTEQRSGYRWLGNQGGYVARHDSYTELFFDSFRKGEHTFRLKFHVEREGEYQTGVPEVTCTYCPDFTSKGKSDTVTIPSHTAR